MTQDVEIIVEIDTQPVSSENSIDNEEQKLDFESPNVGKQLQMTHQQFREHYQDELLYFINDCDCLVKLKAFSTAGELVIC